MSRTIKDIFAVFPSTTKQVSNKGRVRRMTTKRGVSAGILIRPRQAAIDNMTEVI